VVVGGKREAAPNNPSGVDDNELLKRVFETRSTGRPSPGAVTPAQHLPHIVRPERSGRRVTYRQARTDISPQSRPGSLGTTQASLPDLAWARLRMAPGATRDRTDGASRGRLSVARKRGSLTQ